MTKELGKRPGRPAKGQRRKLSFRAQEALEKKLEAAAAATGRSLSEEIEHQLEQAHSLEKLVGHPATLSLVLQVAAIVNEIEAKTGKKWHEDVETKRQVTNALVYHFRVLAPSRGEVSIDISSDQTPFDPELHGPTAKHSSPISR
jgi:hypothetical protein